ncbi:MAG: NUDIX hydrolase [Marinilabiliaceae bacterium]|nr:NUDIX hydrolase [Marinilabiliaceae bacterium]
MVTNIINPHISVDCVIFGFDDDNLNILLVDRTLKEKKTDHIIFNDFTLTGNHIYEKEDLNDAAHRILYDLTGLKNIYLEQFSVFAHPERLSKPNDKLWLINQGKDPESRIISVGYFALIATNNVTLEWKGRNVDWFPINKIKELAFDHNQILNSALKALQTKLLNEPIGFELLPEKFTLSQLQKVYEVILGTSLDKRNFRKKVSRMKYLIPLNEKQKGVAHKPAQLFVFSREIYEKTKRNVFDFSI